MKKREKKNRKPRKQLSVKQAYAVIIPSVLLGGYVFACIMGLISTLVHATTYGKAYANADEGLAYYEECKNTRETDYYVYTEEEMEENSSLKSVKLHYFPATNKVTDRYVLICPGGAYTKICIDTEGYPLAKRANELGVTAFVLEYRVGDDAKDNAPYAPIKDLAEAIKFISSKKAEFNVSDDYSICGFSAGGNLVGLFGTDSLGYKNYGVQKPKSIIMGYPWCYCDENTDSWNMFLALVYAVAGSGSKDMLGKGLKSDAMMIEGRITSDYPASYIVQGTSDMLVPYENALLFRDELNEKGVTNNLKIGKGMHHGFGVGKGSVVEGWFDEALFFGIE